MEKYDLNPSSSIFNTELRRARVDRGLTQRELAAGLGISQVMVQRYEMDDSKTYSARPGLLTTRKIQEFFGQTESVVGAGESADETEEPAEHSDDPLDWLSQVSLDDLMAEIQNRGYRVRVESTN